MIIILIIPDICHISCVNMFIQYFHRYISHEIIVSHTVYNEKFFGIFFMF